MERRKYLQALGANSILLCSGCITSIGDTGSDEESPSNRSSTPDGEDADKMPDQYTFDATISAPTEHVDISGSPVDPPLEESFEQMRLQISNRTNTEITSNDEYGFFPKELNPEVSNAPNRIYFTRDEEKDHSNVLRADESIDQTYTAEFAPYRLEGTYRLTYDMHYQYESEGMETEVTMEIEPIIL